MRLEDLSGIAVTFVVLAVVLGIGAVILGSVKQSQCEDGGYYWNASANNAGNCELNASAGGGITQSTYATNATGGGELGLNELAGWQQTLAIIVVAAVVIGVIGLFYRRN